jgi:hypothetical protein
MISLQAFSLERDTALWRTSADVTGQAVSAKRVMRSG